MRRLLLALVLVLAAAASVRAQPLPTDPRLVTGELDNGLRYIVLRHANPPQRAAIWLHVSSGSLNETDEQRGLAHFLEHLAFNGSEHFPPGSVVPFFESLGLTFGQHQNAFTSFEQTVYQLRLPSAEPEMLDKGMLFLADVAMRLSLLPEEIEAERPVILEERRAHLSGLQRVQEYILERLAPGSILGQRLPIGVEETITAIGRDDFRRYYEDWYVPSNMIVMVAADADPALIVEKIGQHFAGGGPAPAPEDRDAGVAPQTETRAIVASDEELTWASVGLIRVNPAAPPATTVADYRDRLVDRIAAFAFTRRLQRKTAEGSVAWRNAGASVGDSFNTIRTAEVNAMGEAADWERMLDELGAELQRARLHGFTGREVEDARAEMIADAEQAAKREDTLPAHQRLASINRAVAAGERVMSAAQRLELARQVLPTITAEEVWTRFAELFDTSAVTFILQIPPGQGVPTEEALVARGRRALDVAPEAETLEERPESLLAAAPEAGELTDLVEEPESGVWSGWLSNGARVHYRFMDERRDQVTVTITLAGGTIEETAANRGITDAAVVAWSRPATSRLTSTNIRDLMVGAKVSVSGRAGDDTLTLTVSGSPEDLEKGLQLAHLLLTDPKIEPAAFEQWRQVQRQWIEARRVMLEPIFEEVLIETIYPPGEPRVRPMEMPDLERITLAAAQAWLGRLVREAPIEVAVVGDVDRERALGLVRTYLGSLPERERIGPTTLEALRTIERPTGPLSGGREVETQTDKAMVIAGFFGPDAEQLRDVRLLETAARILSTRMIERLREKEGLVYSIHTSVAEGAVYPGYGMVMAFSSTAPDKVGALLEAVRAMFDQFAAEGPTDDEMDVAKRQFETVLEEQLREPSTWQRHLATAEYRGRAVNQPLGALAAYRSFSANEVREAFARYYKPETTFRAYVKPLKPAPEAAAAEDDHAGGG